LIREERREKTGKEKRENWKREERKLEKRKEEMLTSYLLPLTSYLYCNSHFSPAHI
jgi:hypothetical protein